MKLLITATDVNDKGGRYNWFMWPHFFFFFSHKCETPEKFLKKTCGLKEGMEFKVKVSKVLRCVTLNLLKFQELLF